MPQSVLQRMAELSNKKSGTPVTAPAEVSAPLTQEQRKARTRRLIQIGALTDQYLRCAELTPEEVGGAAEGDCGASGNFKPAEQAKKPRVIRPFWTLT